MEEQRLVYDRNPAGYESPLCSTMMAAGEGWGLRHTTDGAWPPDDTPDWAWGAISDYLDWRRFQVLPYPGGVAQQRAQTMAAFRTLDELYDEIDASLAKSREAHKGKGK